MALKYIVVTDCTLTCVPDGVAEIQTDPSSTSSIDGNNIYCGPLTILVTNSTAGGADKNATGIGILMPSSKNNQVDNKDVVLENDNVDITVEGTSSSGSKTTGTVTVTVTAAGQTSTKAD